MSKPNLLLIYTGGTIGMVQDAKSKHLKPFDFGQITDYIPELPKLGINLTTHSFEHPIDSSNMVPMVWIRLATLIQQQYNRYDGFVILHGSDTMAYTASMLSYLLENLNKPVILTGSQLPLGIIRTDGKENIITSIEIAAAKDKRGRALVPEVCIYFEFKLYRGNRTHKYNAEQFKAFQSANFPPLAEAGVAISYHPNAILPTPKKPLVVYTRIDTNVAGLKLFPGITPQVVEAVLQIKGLKAIVLETFGSGNAPSAPWLLALLQAAIKRQVVIVNVTQCNAGSVVQGKYETSSGLKQIGVVGGGDMTFEAAITKLMFLLGQNLSYSQLKKQLATSLRGELSVSNQ